MLLSDVQPSTFFVFRILSPKHRNLFVGPTLAGSAVQNRVSLIFLKATSDKSSHKIVQAAKSSQTMSLLPTNWNLVGVSVAHVAAALALRPAQS